MASDVVYPSLMPSLVRAAAGLGLAGYAWWAVGLPGFSIALTIAIVAPGVLAVVVGALGIWPGRRRPAPSQRPGLAVWIVLIGAMAAWQLAAYLQSPRDDYPTLSSLVNAALDPYPVRAAAFFAWVVIAARLARP